MSRKFKALVAPPEVAFDPELTHPERHVLMLLYLHKTKDDDGAVFPGAERLCAMAGIKHESYLSRITAGLERKGWLRKKRRGRTGRQNYYLSVPDRMRDFDPFHGEPVLHGECKNSKEDADFGSVDEAVDNSENDADDPDLVLHGECKNNDLVLHGECKNNDLVLHGEYKNYLHGEYKNYLHGECKNKEQTSVNKPVLTNTLSQNIINLADRAKGRGGPVDNVGGETIDEARWSFGDRELADVRYWRGDWAHPELIGGLVAEKFIDHHRREHTRSHDWPGRWRKWLIDERGDFSYLVRG